MGGDAGFQVDLVGLVVFLVDLADGAESGEGLAVGLGDGEGEEGADGAEHGAQLGHEFVEAGFAASGDGDGVVVLAEPVGVAVGLGKEVGLVEDHEGGLVGGVDFLEYLVDGGDLLGGGGVGGVDDVQEEVGLDDFLEGGLEGLDELVRELADEADGVAEEGVLVGGQAQAAGGGVEGGKELVLGEDGGAGEGVEKGGLAGVGVADNGDEGPVAALAAAALGGAVFLDVLKVAAQAGDALEDAAAVDLELGLAVAAHADAAFLAGKVGPETGEAREDVLELGELDLHLAFAGAGALGEDVEDEGGAVEDLAVEEALEIAGLGGGKFVVKDDGVDVALLAAVGELGGLALADEGGGVGAVEFLEAVANDVGAGGAGELGEFLEGFAGVDEATVFQLGADEEDPFHFPIVFR